MYQAYDQQIVAGENAISVKAVFYKKILDNKMKINDFANPKNDNDNSRPVMKSSPDRREKHFFVSTFVYKIL